MNRLSLPVRSESIIGYCEYRAAEAVLWRNDDPTFGIQPLPGGDKVLISTYSIQIPDNCLQSKSVGSITHKVTA